ncbi:MAG TPA: HNH endonuclease signature motif containing protein [Thermoanaerobaculia bacterium]
MTENQVRQVFDRTHGHCHFCGDPLEFAKRGWAPNLDGHWEVDHVIQRGKGGVRHMANCLPSCTDCNRLRWHRTGPAVRELLLLGLVAADEVKRQTSIGKALLELRRRRLDHNLARRVRIA